ncbi:neuronal pentraxin-1-like [Arapaima gigas]
MPVRSIYPGLSGPKLLFLLLSSTLITSGVSSALPGTDYDYGAQPKFVCTPIPADADPSCFPVGASPGGAGPGVDANGHHGPSGGGANGNGWWGMTEEAKTTILHLRESLVRQKETILDQRETIRELTAKLTLCEGFGRGIGAHDNHHDNHGPHMPLHSHLHHPYSESGHHSQGHHSNHASDPHYPMGAHRPDTHHRGKAALGGGDKHGTEMASSPEQMGRMLQALKERLENLQQSRNTSSSYSNSLKDLLQRKIHALEQQMNLHSASHGTGDHHGGGDDDHHDDHHGDGHHDDGHHDDGHHDDHHDDDHHDDGHHDDEVDGHGPGYAPRMPYHSQGHRTATHGIHPNKLDTVLSHLHHRNPETVTRKKPKSPDAFQIGFPMRTNYMYGRIKRTLLHEIFALTLCLWLKGGAGPGLGTPFSYSVPGQANELVLIEWGNNPMELLVNDKAVTLPLSLSDGKWHHLCVSWSTRDGLWEAYQDGVKRGSGENLSAWHPIKPGGVFILGQEQDTLGGRFDATQAFVGEISDLQLWSHMLTSHDIYNMATCGSHMTGDVIAWTESVVELHGGVTKYPFDPCH